jgi:hypothetical protein
MDRDWSKLRKWLITKRPKGKSVTAIWAEAKLTEKCFTAGESDTKLKGEKAQEKKPRVAPVVLDQTILLRRT